ncbi:MAG: PD-(D/E)XK nuclease family protein [Flavobacteriaceae bacterium]
MQTFISETLDDILKTHVSFEDCVFVLASQRAGVFLKNTFKEKMNAGFLPEIYNIEQFISQISGLRNIDTIQLLFHFYKIYSEVEEHPDTFENFASWAFVALQDFNEVDQYLINTEDIFNYLRDIQRMKKWSVRGEFKETDLIKDHFFFMERLGKYYSHLYRFLVAEKVGYQGLLYREASKKISTFLNKHVQKKFFFIGFNALNKAEEFLFQEFLNHGNTSIYWDIDTVLYESNHSAGSFIRKYATQWTYYEKHPVKLIGTHFSKKKNIEVIGAAKNISQLKYAGEILEKLENHQSTALVLGDESLLSVALNSIPKEVQSINITMGYPLQDVPASHFITSIFQLFITQDKLQKQETNEFYYKDVIRFFKNPIVSQLINTHNDQFVFKIHDQISKENRSFISFETLESYVKSIEEIAPIFIAIFKPLQSIEDFINRILHFIEQVRGTMSVLEKEYIFRFHNAFTQLKNLNSTHQYFKSVKTLFQFYKRVITNEKLSFQGEPLSGLQLMGMLETRVLDFENIIITSVNEGIIPSNSTQSSFIPFDVKIDFGLPTYREKDAIYSYHFFRLLQRAKNVYLLYNTENDSFGNGEKSRFISQLELMREGLISKFISPKVVTDGKSLKEIDKNEQVLEKLKILAEKGISPSTITNYLYNPIAFYNQKILGIKELDTVEETVAANTMGTVVHDTLDELYSSYINQTLTIEILDAMLKKAKALVQKYFEKHFKNGDISRGRNRLIFEVANRYVERFLLLEKKLVKEGKQLKILATELNLETTISVPGIDFPIKIKGIVDRIDELDGTLRIIDYKTGMVNALNLKVPNIEEIIDFKHSKAIQILLYAYLYNENNALSENTSLEAGIISFKNLKSGFLNVNFSTNYRNTDYQITQDRLESFIAQIKELLIEIYDPEASFKEPLELPY